MGLGNRLLVVSGVFLALSGCGGGDDKVANTDQPPTPTLLNRCPTLSGPTAPAGSLDAMVDGLVAAEMRAAGLPGMTVAIAKNGITLYAKGYGYANLNSCAPVQATTEYQIGSVTKQFTAAAILQLQNAGMLNIDNTVISYLPAYSFDPRITLRMLLNHTAGLDDYVNNPVQFPPPPGWENGVTQQYVLTQIARAPLLFTPGSAFEYSNSGYFILGSIIEVVTGSSYANYLATNILQPVGLSHTYYLQPLTAAQPYTYANPLVPDTTGLAVGIIPDPSVYFASGALWSSVQDLATWDAALRNGDVIPAPLFTVMVTPPASVPIYRQASSASEYAMGWLRTTFLARPIVLHDGQSLAYTAFNGMYLDTGFTVTILTNVDIQGSAGNLDDFAATLIRTICTTASTASSC